MDPSRQEFSASIGILPKEIISKIIRWHGTSLGQSTLIQTAFIKIFHQDSIRELYRYSYIHSLSHLQSFLARLKEDSNLVNYVEELRLSSSDLGLYGGTLEEVLGLIGNRIKFVSFGRIAGVTLSNLPECLVSIDIDEATFPMTVVDNLPLPIPLPQIERLTLRNLSIVSRSPYLNDFSHSLSNSFPQLKSLRIINLQLREYMNTSTLEEITNNLLSTPFDGLKALAYYNSTPLLLLAILAHATQLQGLQLQYNQLAQLAQLGDQLILPPNLKTLKLFRSPNTRPLSSPMMATFIQSAIVSPITTVVVDYSFYSDRRILEKGLQKKGIALSWDHLVIGDEHWKSEWGPRIPDWNE